MQGYTDKGYAERLAAAEIAEARKKRNADLLYLAAHAPHDAPAWFQPVVAGKPKQPTYRAAGLAAERAQRVAREWFRGDYEMNTALDDELRRGLLTSADVESLRAYAVAVENWREECRNWEVFYNTERMAQWPWLWAVHVLNAGDRVVKG